jgi:hypothetical protein
MKLYEDDSLIVRRLLASLMLLYQRDKLEFSKEDLELTDSVVNLVISQTSNGKVYAHLMAREII